MLGLALLIGLAAEPVAAPALDPQDMIVGKGVCESKSALEVGDKKGPFDCTAVIINRTPRGIVVQFAGKGRVLGFAGTLEGTPELRVGRVQIMGTERIYVVPGQPLQADRGSCFLNWKDGKLDYVTCSGGAPSKGGKVWAIVSFVVSSEATLN